MDVELALVFKDIRHTLCVAATHATELKWQRDSFLLSLAHNTNADATDPSSAGELVLKFIRYVLLTEPAHPMLESLLQAFEQDFLIDTDAHSMVLALNLSSNAQRELLNAYYCAASTRDQQKQQRSALVDLAEQGQARLFAIFGGQGTNNPRCVSDLRELYNTYEPFLADLITNTSPLLSELCRTPEANDYFGGRPIDLATWLYNSSSVPNADFVSAAPISFPMIGLLSLAQYCVACKILGRTPGELRSIFQGTTGHSQGLAIAAAISLADSWDSFYEVARLVVELLFWLGFHCHEEAPRGSVAELLVKECTENGEGMPSSMLSVRGLDRAQIEATIARFNRNMNSEQPVSIALVNARDNFVLAGPANALVHLNSQLRAIKADPNLDQNRVPFSDRKSVIHHQFLPISAPFHTNYLREAADKTKDRLFERSVSRDQLMIPVYHSKSGEDLRESEGSDLLDEIVDAIACEECQFPNALNFPDATHIIVFGGGISELISKVKDGEGVRVINVSDLEPRNKEIGTAADLYSPGLLSSSMITESWGKRFQPRLAQSSTGDWILETRLSQLLGTPPVMVAGMTPTTAHWDFVSTIMNAGYHVELAGGGYHNEAAMTSAIDQLVSSLPAGRGVTCNLIYASPQTMAWQVKALQKLVRNGFAIEGLTIGAGVPSPDIVAGYIDSLSLKHISFKPGSIAAIKEVIEIAKAHPDFPVILQWTGGRGGGHHSFEDFHAPIFSSYSMIRKYNNIVLVAGSGFGGADDTYPYLTGTWAKAFGYPLMPFDGVLLGSRMMVAREAYTSPASKQLICQAPGVSNSGWEKTYKGSAGGIITVQSEMGQPIHKIANRGVRLWADMDKLIFSLPRGQRVAKLLKNKDSIIRRLNADFAKPWFGKTSDGQVADLSDMTYMEVLTRLVTLMYVSHQKRWIDKSYTKFVFDFARRSLERLPFEGKIDLSLSELQEPQKFLESFLAGCPLATTTILNPEDAAYFLLRCKSRGQKPVNFVPILDEDFEVYFKKDSLWQSEDVDAVVDQDAGRVCILHGPVAAQYCQQSDESAKDILDGISRTHVAMLLHDQHEMIANAYPESQSRSVSQSGSLTPESWSFGSPRSSITTPMESPPYAKDRAAQQDFFGETADQLPSTFTAGRCSNSSTLIRALFNTDSIVQGRQNRPSPFRRVLETRPGTALRFDRDNTKLVLERDNGADSESLVEIFCEDNLNLTVELHQLSAWNTGSIVLPFKYELQSSQSPWAFSEIMTGRNERIKSFYSKLWFGEELDPYANAQTLFRGQEMTLSKDLYQSLVSTVGQSYSNSALMLSNSDVFPISAGIIIVWDVITKPLVLNDIDGDLLRLVHQSNTFEYCEGASPLRIGDRVSSQSRVQSIYIEEAGKYVVVEATVSRESNPILIVRSTFLFKGSFTDYETTFRTKQEEDMTLQVPSRQDEAILLDREWFKLHDTRSSLVGKTLLFKMNTAMKWKSQKVFSELSVTGTVFEKLSDTDVSEIGTIDFQSQDCVGNPVVDFLERKGLSTVSESNLTHPGWSGDRILEVQIPNSNERYAKVSKDYNPIHVSSVFADWAELPGTITHGMYTSAVAAGILEHLGAEGNPARFHRFSATFTGMVLPEDKLSIHLQHTGMVQGRMRFDVSAYKLDTEEKVLVAEAEIEQAKTAYIFTGQGSQSKGMGMELYNNSPVAKAIWDDIDKHLYDTYGWSILDIVRNNPKSLTVHFGGKRGRKLRENYMAMQIETQLPDGTTLSKPILPGLNRDSRSYTFSESRGLLFSTQFAQPAILLLEKATFEDMRTKGLVQNGATYAGHSLGEYGSLSAFSGFLSLRSLMEVVFYRGLTMQVSMERDEHGETGFSMIAANPKRVRKGFTEEALRRVVSTIALESKALLEIVNYNVEGEQYVCAGTSANLHVLGLVLNHLSKASNGDNLVNEVINAEDLLVTELHKYIVGCIAQTQKLPKPLELQRGVATIPLKGIDVPFHSTHLRPGVLSYRRFLQQRILESNIVPEKLVGKFVPNVMAQPFSLDESYIKEAFRLTQSPELRDLLERGIEA